MKQGEEGRLIFCIAAGIALWRLGTRAAAVLVPLGIAYAAARIARPTGLFFAKLCGGRERVVCSVYAVLVCGGVIYGVSLLSGKLISQLWALLEDLPRYAEEAAALLWRLYDLLPFGAEERERAAALFSDAFGQGASWLVNELGGLLAKAVQGVPGGVLSVLVAVVGFLYLTADLPGAGKSLASLVPGDLREGARRLFGNASDAMFSYLRAHLILMLVTFMELSVGLSIIGVSTPLASGLLIAAVDALPLFGCGTVLVPWAVWNFFAGDFPKGVGLLILLGIVYVVRQLLEPRVIGQMTGVHPFVALVCVFTGWKIAGVIGMIAAPMLLLCLRPEGEMGEDDGGFLKNSPKPPKTF